jgi:hypothetical protein
MPSKLPLWAAALLTLCLPAVASADPLGQTSHPSPIRASGDQAVWSTAAPGSKTYTLTLDGRPLAAQATGKPVQADVSRGPGGKPLIVVARKHAIASLDPATGARKRLATTHSTARSPVLWGSRLAWVEGPDRVYTAKLGHRARHVRAPRGTISELALHGSELAITLNSGADLGDSQVWLQRLDGTHAKLVRKVSSGESDRWFVGPSFDRGAFYFAQVCAGDPAGCHGHGTAYRYRAGRLTSATVPLDLSGFAQAGGWSYWVTERYGACLDDAGEDAPCTVERTKLSFSR